LFPCPGEIGVGGRTYPHGGQEQERE
jgi:hypothetical protein